MFKDDISKLSNMQVPTGKATIQIFNEQGNVVEEMEHDNYVHPMVLKAISEMTNYGIYGSDVYNPSSFSDSAYGSNSLFSGMVLTDSDSPANPEKDRYVEGNLIGIARKGYNGAGSLRGSYNSVESEHSTYYHKYVYDFRTSEANGTFQSIYMGGFDYSSSNLDEAYTTPVVLSGGLDFSVSWTEFVVEGEYFYYAHSSTNPHIYRYKLEDLHNVVGGFYDGLSRVHYELPVNHNGFTIKGDRFYVITSGGHIDSIAINDLSDSRREWTYSSDTLRDLNQPRISSSYVDGISYRAEKNTFLVGYRQSDGHIMEFDADTFNVVKTYEGLGNWAGQGANVSKFNNNLLVGRLGRLVDLSIGEVTQRFKFDESLIELSPVFSLNLSGTSRGYIVPSPQFFSRVVLDSPVTKTSQNTMKITYEYTVPKVDLFIDDNFDNFYKK